MNRCPHHRHDLSAPDLAGETRTSGMVGIGGNTKRHWNIRIFGYRSGIIAIVAPVFLLSIAEKYNAVGS